MEWMLLIKISLIVGWAMAMGVFAYGVLDNMYDCWQECVYIPLFSFAVVTIFIFILLVPINFFAIV